MAQAQKVDRQTTAPFLLRLFYRTGSFHKYDTPATPSSETDQRQARRILDSVPIAAPAARSDIYMVDM
jgi:hypothetical protein